MASHDGISPVGVGGKRTRIPAEDPEDVRERDNARWPAKHSRKAGGADPWDMSRADYFGDNTAKTIEENDCGN